MRPGKWEIHTASIAITTAGPPGGDEAVGTAGSMIFARITLPMCRRDAFNVSMLGQYVTLTGS